MRLCLSPAGSYAFQQSRLSGTADGVDQAGVGAEQGQPQTPGQDQVACVDSTLQWPCALLDQGLIDRVIHSPDGLALGQPCRRDLFSLAAGMGIGDEKFVGESGNKLVALVGRFHGDALAPSFKGGEEKQAARVQGLAQVDRHPSVHAPGQDLYHRPGTTQEHGEDFCLCRGLEAADEQRTVLAPALGQIVQGQEDAWRRTGRTEEAQAGLVQEGKIAFVSERLVRLHASIFVHQHRH